MSVEYCNCWFDERIFETRSDETPFCGNCEQDFNPEWVAMMEVQRNHSKRAES